MTTKIHRLFEDGTEFDRLEYFMALLNQQYLEQGLLIPTAEGAEKIWRQNVLRTLGRSGLVAAAIDSDAIVGFIHATMYLSRGIYGTQKLGRIEHIYIDPSYRRKHCGQKLFAEAAAWFAEQNATGIELNVLSGNDAAKGFWSSLGFEVESWHYRKYPLPDNPW